MDSKAGLEADFLEYQELLVKAFPLLSEDKKPCRIIPELIKDEVIRLSLTTGESMDYFIGMLFYNSSSITVEQANSDFLHGLEVASLAQSYFAYKISAESICINGVEEYMIHCMKHDTTTMKTKAYLLEIGVCGLSNIVAFTDIEGCLYVMREELAAKYNITSHVSALEKLRKEGWTTLHITKGLSDEITEDAFRIHIYSQKGISGFSELRLPAYAIRKRI